MKRGHEGASGFYASKLYSFIYLCPLDPKSLFLLIFPRGRGYPPSTPFALWKGSSLKSPKTSLLPEVKVIPPEDHATFSIVLPVSS